jgi:hypothetical protein
MLLLARPAMLRGKRVGLIANPTAVTPDLTHAALALLKTRAIRLVALFGPEHGIWADAQDLIEVEDSRDARTGLPVFSLYGTHGASPRRRCCRHRRAAVRHPGCRLALLHLHLHDAARDGGVRRAREDAGGARPPQPDRRRDRRGQRALLPFRSFVGQHPLAARHGMTVGELALMFQDELRLDLELHVVKMKNWRRRAPFEQTGLPWVMPSPNMPTVDNRVRLPGRLPDRRHEPVRRPRHHPALRAGRRALARPVGARRGDEPRAAAGRALPRGLFHAHVPEARRPAVAAAWAFTSPSAGCSRRSSRT